MTEPIAGQGNEEKSHSNLSRKMEYKGLVLIGYWSNVLFVSEK